MKKILHHILSIVVIFMWVHVFCLAISLIIYLIGCFLHWEILSIPPFWENISGTGIRLWVVLVLFISWVIEINGGNDYPDDSGYY
jgi:hypothetical protein